MVHATDGKDGARLVQAGETLDVLGPQVQFITDADDAGESPCIMRGTIPPGTVIPLHSHADPETFIAVSGEVEGLAQTRDGFQWLTIAPGDVFHVPGHAGHGFRNPGSSPAVMIIVSTPRIGRFFREVGVPVAADGPPLPTQARIGHFLEVAERYGYWNATPEENAQVGISLAPPSS